MVNFLNLFAQGKNIWKWVARLDGSVGVVKSGQKTIEINSSGFPDSTIQIGMQETHIDIDVKLIEVGTVFQHDEERGHFFRIQPFYIEFVFFAKRRQGRGLDLL